MVKLTATQERRQKEWPDSQRVPEPRAGGHRSQKYYFINYSLGLYKGNISNLMLL